MALLLLFIALGAIQSTSGQGGSEYCPKEENAEFKEFTIGASCYRVVETVEGAVTYESASETCRIRKGHLLTIKNNATQTALVAGINNASDSHTVLLGLRKRGNQWTWVTGDQATYTNWDPDSIDGDCAKLLLGKSGLWEKVACTTSDWFTVYVCEYSNSRLELSESAPDHHQTHNLTSIDDRSFNGGYPLKCSVLTMMSMALSTLFVYFARV